MSATVEVVAGSLIERAIEMARRGPGVVAILARSTESLDAWGRAFARRVRASRGLSLEIYMPATSEALIARFNHSLLGLSLDQARAEAPDDQPRRIILVPDAHGFDTPEGLLLARLISDFPGTGTRLVVLIDQDGSTSERLLAALGRSAQRIDLDHTSEAEDPTPIRADRSAIVHQAPGLATEARPVVHQPIEMSSAGPGHEPIQGARRSSARWLGAGALVMALLLISALIVVLLHREPAPASTLDRRSGTAAPALSNESGRSSLGPVGHAHSGA